MKDSFEIDTLIEQCKNDTQLFGIMFVLLSRCNHDCVHCYIPDHASSGLDTQTVKRTIDQARALGALNVTFTGGEILLRKDLLELVRHARSKYMRVFLMSNGYGLDEHYVQQLADLHIAEFSTTVYSMDPEVHDRITRVPGSFRKTIHNIALLKAHNIEVTVKTPLMEYNKYAYKEVEEYARSNGFNFRTSPSIFSRTNGESTPHDHEIQADLCTVVRETDAVNARYRGEIVSRNDGTIPCIAGHSNICVNYDGNVWPCNTLPLNVGDIHLQSLEEIWHHSRELNGWRSRCRMVPEPCKACQLHKKCVRCPGLAYLEDNDLYGCSSAARKIAEQRN